MERRHGHEESYSLLLRNSFYVLVPKRCAGDDWPHSAPYLWGDASKKVLSCCHQGTPGTENLLWKKFQRLTGQQNNWKDSILEEYFRTMQWYTDDSKTADRIGGGIVGPRTKLSVPMTGFQAFFKLRFMPFADGLR